MDLELWLEVGYDSKQVCKSSHDGIEIKVDVVRPDLDSKLFRSVSCFFTRVLGAHEAGVEYAAKRVSYRYRIRVGAIDLTCKLPGLWLGSKSSRLVPRIVAEHL